MVALNKLVEIERILCVSDERPKSRPLSSKKCRKLYIEMYIA